MDIRAEIQKLEERRQTEEAKWNKERARLEAERRADILSKLEIVMSYDSGVLRKASLRPAVQR